MTDIWDQLTLDGTSPKVTAAPNTCRDCGALVRRIIAGDICGWPATVAQHPVDRVTALALVATGRSVYIHRRHKRSASWTRLEADTIGSAHAAAGDHHPEHACGKDPPPPPPKPDPHTYPHIPPF